ncbi:bifunctional anthranilate synthase component I family protein/class IV aminotransferase [Helicobacter burdigaliensis]|uniref:chorismate-binding protein n=1 Tax=Helicobacter burdigaliensis TaxID=2315334 RepID=UPI000EF64403|nr:bifunctional anthranilate synthase component I family protein/class IV aminotransferase [Helicobacter burdigaliensis]
MKNTSPKENFAIFDDYLYYELKHILKAYNQKESKQCFKFIEKNKHKFFFIGCIDYEFYRYLEDESYKSNKAYLGFFAFKKRKKFKPKKVCKKEFMPTFLQTLDKKEYANNFKKVKNAIAKGQSYQVNLTQEIKFSSKIEPFRLFNLLLQRQNTSFKAFLPMQEGYILSFSPELFFKTKGRNILTEPMKGTSKRAHNKKQDRKNKKFLQKDVKNLSENVMIVDLLRNDLSKIIQKHSLKEKLFRVQTLPTLHQMTSKIKGRLKKGIGFYDIFKALFPCGSITGAPKLETMRLISSLEARERGIYCGSIGLISKNKSKFSVAIRTLEQKDNIYHYGVGSGLVWDSKENEEFCELHLKTKFLKNEDFYLFETMLYKNNKILFLKQHLQRLLESALKLNFNTGKITKDFWEVLEEKINLDAFKTLDIFMLNQKLFQEEHCLLYPYRLQEAPQKDCILRLVLYKNGAYDLQSFPIKHSLNDKLLLSDITLNSKSDSLYFKSSFRGLYEAQSHKWREDLCYDVVFFNELGELCEGTRTNILIQKQGEFYTPSLECGLLNGIYREFLLNLGLIKEAKISKKDLQEASKIYAFNSVRGLREVRL